MEPADMKPDERAAELDDDAGIGRQISLTDDSADSALAADQNGFDVPAVLTCDQVRGQARPTRKMDCFDAVGRIIEQVVWFGVPMRDIRRDQRKISPSSPPQKVVVGPLEAI